MKKYQKSYCYMLGYNKLFLSGTSELRQYHVDLLFTKKWNSLIILRMYVGFPVYFEMN